MKIISVHNYYQNRGGEDQLFEDEAKLLEEHGHEIIWHTTHSDSINERNLIGVAVETLWNRRSHREMTDLIREHSPDVIHSVNTFPLFSPSIFHAARKLNIPLVATIQNYRYFCAQAMCYRNGKACEDCLGKLPWRAVRHGCYKDSTAGSAVVSAMQLLHQKLGTWKKYVDVICVASEFSKGKMMQAGLEDRQMIIKPNFVPKDPGPQPGDGGYAVFVGRLSSEKGIQTLVECWRELNSRGIQVPLKIVGDGPESEMVRMLAEDVPSVDWVGLVPNEEVYRVVGEANCLIFPSTGYESLPKTLIESMAVATPVVGSDIGSIPEVVLENETGHLFPAGDSNAMAACVLKFFTESGQPTPRPEMRGNCRSLFEKRYTRESNYEQLIQIYHEAIRRRQIAIRSSSAGSQADGIAVTE